jgi:hypothetical protein
VAQQHPLAVVEQLHLLHLLVLTQQHKQMLLVIDTHMIQQLEHIVMLTVVIYHLQQLLML